MVLKHATNYKWLNDSSIHT